jgi:hypothetical protein
MTYLLFVMSSLLLLVFQRVTLAKFIVWPPSMSFASFAAFAQAATQDVHFSFFDITIICLFLSFILLLIAFEWRQGALTELMMYVLRGEKRAIVFFLLSSIVFVRYYLAPGKPNWAADGSIHIIHALLTAKAFAQGEWPIYTFKIGAGSPYLLFYGCLFFYATAFVDFFLNNFYLSLKTLLFFAHVFSGLGVYLWVCTLFRSRAAGLIAGWVYIMGVWHPQQILYMGGYPLSLVYALLPWPFYFFEAVISKRLKPSTGTSAGALALGLLGLNHPGYAAVGTSFFVLYCAIRILSGHISLWRYAALILIGGIAIGSYMTVGFFVESDQATLFESTLSSSGTENSPTWRHLLYWSNIRYRISDQLLAHWYGAYLGLSAIALAFAGLLKRQPCIYAVWLNLVICLGLVFGPDISHLFHAPLEPHRHLLFALFFLAPAAGWGARVVLCITRQQRVFTLICIALLLDLGATTFQHPFASYQTTGTGISKEFYEQMKKEAESFPSGEIPNYRLLWATGAIHGFLASGEALFYTSTPISSSVHDLPASRMVESVRDLLTYEVNEDSYETLESVPSVDLILKAAYLLNVRYLLYTYDHGDQTEQAEMMRISPVVASSKLRVLDSDKPIEDWRDFSSMPSSLVTRAEHLSRLINFMDVDITNNQCDRIFVRNMVDERTINADPEVKLWKHVVKNEAVELHITMSDSGFVRLSYAYFPQLKVTVDDREINPIVTEYGFMALSLDAGKHVIKIEPRLSLLRTVLLLVGLGSIVMGLFWIAVSSFRDRNTNELEKER